MAAAGGVEVEVKVDRRGRSNMVLKSRDFWHMSMMLTQSIERLSIGTDLTDSAQLLCCRGAHKSLRTKIACCGPQLDATILSLSQCQVILSYVNNSQKV